MKILKGKERFSQNCGRKLILQALTHLAERDTDRDRETRLGIELAYIGE